MSPTRRVGSWTTSGVAAHPSPFILLHGSCIASDRLCAVAHSKSAQSQVEFVCQGFRSSVIRGSGPCFHSRSRSPSPTYASPPWGCPPTRPTASPHRGLHRTPVSIRKPFGWLRLRPCSLDERSNGSSLSLSMRTPASVLPNFQNRCGRRLLSRQGLRTADIPKLGVILPHSTSGRPSSPSLWPCPWGGWVESPPYFTALTETACDLANYASQPGAPAPRVHPLERVSQTPAQPAPASHLPSMDCWRANTTSFDTTFVPTKPLSCVDVYVDDFLL
jgi:hypothetical protein